MLRRIEAIPAFIGSALAIAALVTVAPAAAAQYRSRAVLAQFQLEHPCPATGLKTGACPGWQKDHLIPLECGGADAVWNLHWLTVADHAAKTKLDNIGCRMIKGAVVRKDQR